MDIKKGDSEDIKREASDKHKGVTLQKLRAIQLIFEKIKTDSSAQIHVAIEHEGDVFIYSDAYKFLEENKNYDSKNFSFLSAQVLNTLVYFLDYWLKDHVNRSEHVFFTFYSTNKIAKEKNSEHVRSLGCELPDKPILELLGARNYTYTNILTVCKKAVLSEYDKQYKGKNHFKTIENFTDEEWKQFFNQISWHFEMPANSEVKKIVHDSIREFAEQKGLNILGKEDFIEAMLRMRLEDKQEESDRANRFLTSDSVELIFHKIVSQPVDKKLYRFLDIDYTELNNKLGDFSSRFLLEKYNSITSKRSAPQFLDRKVRQHNSELKIDKEKLEAFDHEVPKNEVIFGTLESFVSSRKPNFLFGEIGGGKSSLVAKFAHELSLNDKICILIPVNYIKGKIDQNFSSLYSCIDTFIESNIVLKGSVLPIEYLLRNTSVTLIFDGLDELGRLEARSLTRHLEQLNQEEPDVTIVASGRPLELQSVINFNSWNCLTTTDLAEEEILEILKNEAVCSGLSIEQAVDDSLVRFEFLKSRQELFAIAKTPLVICMIRDFLNSDLDDHSLGSLMYIVLTKRLEWDETDLKSNYNNFLESFSTNIEREKIISQIAEAMFTSEKRALSSEHLSQIITDIILTEGGDRKTIPEAISFYKNVFLQETAGLYSFISQPLLETAYAVKLAADFRKEGCVFDLNDNNWRAFSFAIAVNRVKGFSEKMEVFLINVLTELLRFENNTAVASIIITESKSPELSLLFIEKVSELSFRPLRVFGSMELVGGADLYSKYAMAYTISLAKDDGIKWFFAEYLDPIHPFNNDGHTIEDVLANLFSLLDYKLEARYLEKLLEFFNYHLASRTIACSSLLPVLVLVIISRIDARVRCLLLTDILYHPVVGKKAKELLLIESASDNIVYVRDGLEVVASKNETRNVEAVLFWFQIHIAGQSLNENIINAAIKIAAKGNDGLFEILIDKIGKENFCSFLRFQALSNLKEAAGAAVLLYSKFKESDFYLVARPLLADDDLYSFKDEKKRKILEDLLFKFPNESIEFARANIPRRRTQKDETTEIFIYNFNKLLTETDYILKNEFLDIVTYLPSYPVLSREAEIRDSYKKLLEAKPQYIEFLRQASDGLDFHLRQNANSILLCCFPENSKREIERVIHSAYMQIGSKGEWLKFCIKLSFSNEVLAYVYSLLPSLLEVSKYYALCLLYRNKFHLSKNEKDCLVEGLCGAGYFLDIDLHYTRTNSKRIAGEPEFFPKLIEILNGTHEKYSENAANILLDYHDEKLTKAQKAKCLILRNENWMQFFFEVNRMRPNLFKDEEFVAEFDKVNESLGEKTLLGYYKKALYDGNDCWLDILKKISEDHIGMMDAEYQFFYNWLVGLRKRRSDLTLLAGQAAINFLDFPVIKEKTDFGATLPFLAVIAAEFSDFNNDALEEVLKQYHCQEDTVCSILRRLGKIPEYYPLHREKLYLTVFSENRTRNFTPLKTEELEKFLYDGDDIPRDIIFNINSILINATNLHDEMKDSLINKMKALIISVVYFCRNEDVNFDLILGAVDKIGLPWYNDNVNFELRDLIFIIKEMKLRKVENKELYAGILKTRIENNNGVTVKNPDDDFLELLLLGVSFDFNILKIILNDLVQKTYLFKLTLMFEIFKYTVYRIPESDKPKLSLESERILKSLMNRPLEKGENGNLNQIMWMMSLLSFYLDKESREYSLLGYLKGLESLFISHREYSYNTASGGSFSIKGRDLIYNSDVILEHINQDIFQEALQKGAEIGTPEIKAICRMFSKVFF